MNPFLEGMIAGYGIAIPVGAIAILIFDAGLRRGFRIGWAAGAGAASADLIYASLAALAGEVLSGVLEPFALALRIASAGVLLLLGGLGLWKTFRRRPVEDQPADAEPLRHRMLPVYGQFLGLTLLNPATVAYFGALILGGGTSGLDSLSGRLLFVLGAALASFSWQSLLALLGVIARRGLPPRFQIITSIVGNLVVIGLGLRILIPLLLE